MGHRRGLVCSGTGERKIEGSGKEGGSFLSSITSVIQRILVTNRIIIMYYVHILLVVCGSRGE